MCGIAGKIYFDNSRLVEDQLIQNMTSTLSYRGPDDSGYFVDGHMGFGMRRLSIIDLAAGQQPIFNEDKSLAIVFNGEIYNYRELKATLEKLGHRFRTNSDTEVILHCYEHYSVECLQHLNGMFALAIFNLQTHSLFLARDRLGIKPLYYFLDDEQLVFGSELKAILADPSIPRHLDYQALDLYLRYLYVPAPHSMFAGIRKLPAGYFMMCTPEKTAIQQYWDVTFAPDTTTSESDFIAEFNALFHDSVHKRMISDVPLGAFLSGGIDSSSIVAEMTQISQQPVKTFAIGFKAGGYHDESHYAEFIAEIFQTDHTTFKVGSEMLDMLPLYVHHFDEPFGDYAAFPTYVVSKLAREHVTVVLTGDGSDEIFAGYERYASEQLARYYRYIPAWLRNHAILPLLKTGQSLISPNLRLSHYFSDAIKKTKLMQMDAGDRYITGFHKFNDAMRHALCTMPSTNGSSLFQSYWNQHTNADILSRQLYTDIKTSLPDDMLTKVDRVTMAASLEARVPFLDHRIVELSARIPSSMKLRPWLLKRFLKQAKQNTLPDVILHRRKHGFSAPMDRWLRHEMHDLLRDTLSADSLRSHELFNAPYIQGMIDDHLKGATNNGVRLFMLMVFQMWHEKYLSNSKGNSYIVETQNKQPVFIQSQGGNA